jgi:hypothetical protein
MPKGSYRVAFSCSSQWDGPEDSDYPGGVGRRFGFQAYSEIIEVNPGMTSTFDIH